MGDLSAHFSYHEFRDKRTGAVKVDPELVRRLELLRSIIGNRPIVIVSGFRSRSTNTAVGGAKKSQHLVGRAVDIPRGVATLSEAYAAGFRGVGTRGRWAVHVDVRPGTRIHTWSYGP